MSEDLNKSEQQPEQEAVDPIALLAERLGMIEAALGVGNSGPNQSNLLSRLSAIETSLSKPERERTLPATITCAEAANPSFLKKSGVLLEDITSGRVRVEG